MKPLIVIPARGGSKRIPLKNITFLGGKPLIHYTLKVAREVFDDANIFVSTDSPDIKAVVEDYGLKVPFLRPDILATDTAGTYEVLLHALDFHENNCGPVDVIILLQPTSPFRKPLHVWAALALYSSDIDMVVSVKETSSNPYYVLFEEDESGFLKKSKKGNFSRRQDCPKVWEYNGSIYVINPESLKKMSHLSFPRVIKYEMDELVSMDIDTPTDLMLAECMLQKIYSGSLHD